VSLPVIAPSRHHRQNRQRPLTLLTLVRSRSNGKTRARASEDVLRGVGQGRAVTACAGSALPLENKDVFDRLDKSHIVHHKTGREEGNGRPGSGGPRETPLPPVRETRKNASTTGAKSVILWRGSKLSERLSIFSRRSANNGQGVPCLRLCITGLRPKDSRQGLSPSPIGSPFTAEPWPLNVHAGFEGMRLQNCIGSG
jgi:hypothetical protein